MTRLNSPLHRASILAAASVAAMVLTACTPSGGATPTPSSSAGPTTSAAPSEPPFDGLRSPVIDDAAALAHLAAPRTGETWHAPVALAADPGLFDPASGILYFSVGDHNGADIVVAIDQRFELDSFVLVQGLFEIDAAGARFISCPSARTSDPCVVPPDGLTVDTETFYDSLTYPAAFEVLPGYVFTTAATLHTFDPWETLLGDGNFILPAAGGSVIDPRADATVTVLASFGDTEIVQLEWPSFGVAGVSNLNYALRLPTGAIQIFSGSDVPAGSYNSISWMDGVARTALHEWRENDWVMAPSSGVCFPGQFSLETAHVNADWVAGGTAPGGITVYLPAPGGNAVASNVRSTMDEWSYGFDWETGMEIPYPFATDADFLAANALFAVQRPDGAWLLGLRPDATNLAYECV